MIKEKEVDGIKYLANILRMFSYVENRGEEYWKTHNDIASNWLNKGYRVDLEGMKDRMLQGAWSND